MWLFDQPIVPLQETTGGRRPGSATTQYPGLVHPEEARSLCGLLIERARRTPDGPAYTHHDQLTGLWKTATWSQTLGLVGRWQGALRAEGLRSGERVAIMTRNRPDWVHFDLAALGLGLVTVPLYPNDRPESVRHQLVDSGTRLLVLEDSAALDRLAPIAPVLEDLHRILVIEPPQGELPGNGRALAHWLPESAGLPQDRVGDPGDLATIVYTSGTTGPAKGVMLTHWNLLWNAAACLSQVPARPDDRFLSFLPLSHTLERTAGYYLPLMAGAEVIYARSIPQLAEDLEIQHPTVLIAVPRIFERVHGRLQESLNQGAGARRWLFRAAVEIGWRGFEHRQGRAPWSPLLIFEPWLDRLVGARVRARLGGRIRVAVCGGAPVSPEIARTFVALGLPLLQGYGLTEASPVISVNTLSDNIPQSVGPPLPRVEWHIGPQDELLVRSPGVMKGYWCQPESSAAAVDPSGWLHTGDQARFQGGHLYITGRVKDVLVLDTGEKVAPADLEAAILGDDLFSQVLVLGEGRPFLAALVVLNADSYGPWALREGLAAEPSPGRPGSHIEQALLARMNQRLKRFPAHATVRHVALVARPWTVESGLLTPTLKLKRARILGEHRATVDGLYRGSP